VKQSGNSRIVSPPRSPLDSSARPGRIVAFDYLRGFVTTLVVLHHSLLAYCQFGYFDRQHYLWSTAPIVDHSKWLGFDLIVMFNDGYFMPLMFLLSGLFVWPSLARKGSAMYCRDRLLRLGMPFAVAVTTVIPLAYYPSFRMTGSDVGFGVFWMRTVFAGPWPAGPVWFLAVLLAFDLVAALVHSVAWRANDAATLPRPLVCFGLLTALSALGYLPLLALFGPTRWLTFGPFAVQASRIGLYAAYFLGGIFVGRHRLDSNPDARRREYWARWALLAALLFVCFVAVQAARLVGWPTLPPRAWLSLYGINLVVFCAAANFAWLAIFVRFAKRSIDPWNSLAINAYGIYLLHYPAVTWTQYALLDLRLHSIVKAALVFIVALLLSWGSTIVLRRIPGIARVI
jgi:glucans biosynthesis protein C